MTLEQYILCNDLTEEEILKMLHTFGIEKFPENIFELIPLFKKYKIALFDYALAEVTNNVLIVEREKYGNIIELMAFDNKNIANCFNEIKAELNRKKVNISSLLRDTSH